MIWNLTDCFQNAGREISRTISFGADHFTFGGEDFGLVEDCEMNLTAAGIDRDKAVLRAEGRLVFAGVCDRCLSPAQIEIPIVIDREVASPDYPEPDEELREFMEGYSIDTDALLRNEISLNWPVKILCREDCKGLCPVCGRNLNEGDCGCDTFVPDPRMAALKDIFERSKEV
ncbi:MAG: DUF177 domain-containing protein [Lachnospiraceae bacterium]|jgi:uncharacterized protein|nr:DUF177 domain-containing protein [Lachnospiraceae bacterium]